MPERAVVKYISDICFVPPTQRVASFPWTIFALKRNLTFAQFCCSTPLKHVCNYLHFSIVTKGFASKCSEDLNVSCSEYPLSPLDPHETLRSEACFRKVCHHVTRLISCYLSRLSVALHISNFPCLFIF